MNNGNRTETSDKTLPALKVGGIELIPAATLPLPLGKMSENSKQDGGDEWENLAVKVLIPRWAAECIRDELVMGQELEGDVSEDRNGCLPIESIKQRIDLILKTPGELDKWKRIAGWGIEAVRQLDLDSAKKWNGGLRELLKFGNAEFPPLEVRVAFAQRWHSAITVFYWTSWAREGWPIVQRCFQPLPSHRESSGCR